MMDRSSIQHHAFAMSYRNERLRDYPGIQDCDSFIVVMIPRYQSRYQNATFAQDGTRLYPLDRLVRLQLFL